MRLDKFLSNNTELSRAQISTQIKNAAATVNDIVQTKSNVHINPHDIIRLNDQIIEERKLRYVMLHKPAGYVSANTDSEHPTVLDLINLPYKSELQIAGRLDVDTTGLVLLTDDGQWNHKITSPKQRHTKCYLATTADPINPSAIETFFNGILLHNETKKPYLQN